VVVAVAGHQVEAFAFEGFSQYSVRALARVVTGQGELLTMSPATVQRILAAGVLKPHRVRYWLTRTDPDFARKMAAIVTLSLDPPRHSRLLCLDEKSHLQALERLHPPRPRRPGLVERQEFAYLRHGVVDLFAARGRIAPRGAARAQGPRSAARRVPLSGGAAQSPAAGGRQRGV
jgi:hypothetical protein